MTCTHCATKAGKLAFECIGCCVRWLSRMTREEVALNAPTIQTVMGAEHMDKVREAFKARKS